MGSNVNKPAVVFSVAEQGTDATISKIKSQFTAMVSEIQGKMGSLSPALQKRLESFVQDMDGHWDKQLNKITNSLAKGNWSATKEKMLTDISELTAAVGKFQNNITSQTANTLRGVSEQINLPKLISDLRAAAALPQQAQTASILAAVRGPSANAAWLASRPQGDQSATDAWRFSHPTLLAQQPFEQQDLRRRLEVATRQQEMDEFRRPAHIRRAVEMGHHARQYADAEIASVDASVRSQRMQRLVERSGNPEQDFANLLLGGKRSQDHPDDIKAGIASRQAAFRDLQKIYRTIDRHANDPAESFANMDLSRNQGSPLHRRSSDHARRFANMSLGDRNSQGQALYTTRAEHHDRFLSDELYGPLPPDLVEKQRRARGPWWNRSITGNNSNPNGHNFRFGMQQVGFGIDDAIQSYQYGGFRASTRAMSNNLTAIAGMGISSPVAAAGTVVGLSVLTAALPLIMDRFWAKEGPSLEDRMKIRQNRLDYQSSNGQSYRAAMLSSSQGQGGTTSAYLKSLTDIAEATGRSDDLINQSSELSGEKSRLLAERKRSNGLRNKGSGPMTWMMYDLYQKMSPIDDQSEELGDVDKSLKVNSVERHKQLEVKLQAENNSKRLRSQLEEGRKLQTASTVNERNIEESMSRGEYANSGEVSNAMRSFASQQIASIQKNNKLTPSQRRLATESVNQTLADKLADPALLQRQVAIANEQYSVNKRHFYEGISANNGLVAGVYSSTRNTGDSLYADHLSGRLSKDEYQTRSGALKSSFDRDRERAVRDDLQSLNPEQNPYFAMNKNLAKSVESLTDRGAAGQLTPEEYRQQALAVFDNAQRQYVDYQPGGQRRFTSSGTTVNSQADAELEARMLGNFGPRRDEHDLSKEGLDKIYEAILKLSDNLQTAGDSLDAS